MAAETEAAAGNATINYEAASTAVETEVVAVDAAAAPEAGNSGSGYGSSGGSGVEVSSGDDDGSDDSNGNGDSNSDDDDRKDDDESGDDDDNGGGDRGKHRQQSVTMTGATTTACGGDGNDEDGLRRWQ
jgi:hypothetical protein